MTDRPEFICPADTRKGLAAVFRGEYDIADLTFEKPPVVLDIGANLGAFAIWAVSRWPGCTVHCFEPHPDNATILRKNVADHLANIRVNEAAVVGDPRNGSVVLYDGTSNCGCHSLHDVGEQDLAKTHVVKAFDAALLPDCDVLKLDTEGHELQILSEYPHLHGCQAVMLEWHRASDRWLIGHILTLAGLRCVYDAVWHKERGIMKWRRGEAS